MRREAKQALKYPHVRLNGHQALWIARAFREVLEEAQCQVYACGILPDHVHLVVSKSRFMIERLAQRLKARATVVLEREGMHPFQKFPRMSGHLPKMWVRREWTVYLNSATEVRQKIRYVENNPLREGLPRQRWSFVTPYP